MKITRNLWPLGLFTAFGLFFAGMASVVVIAATHREHLVNANYYEQELKFQSRIESRERAEKSGATIAFDAPSGSILVALPAALLGQNLSGMLELYRPAEPKLDCEFPLAPRADGTQAFNVSKLARGLWVARVLWSAGGYDYFLEQKIKI